MAYDADEGALTLDGLIALLTKARRTHGDMPVALADTDAVCGTERYVPLRADDVTVTDVADRMDEADVALVEAGLSGASAPALVVADGLEDEHAVLTVRKAF